MSVSNSIRAVGLIECLFNDPQPYPTSAQIKHRPLGDLIKMSIWVGRYCSMSKSAHWSDSF